MGIRSAQDDVVRNMLNQISEPFSIVLDHAPMYPIVPNPISKEQEEQADADAEDVGETNEEVREGEIEYMVSNGLPNRRSHSVDVYTWSEAVETAKRLQKEHDDDKDRRGMP